MDPVSTFLAAYISAVTTSVQQNVTDIYGTEIKTEFIKYKGMNISFQYQLWRIRDKSVCASYDQGMPTYSKCTINAKSLFKDICKELSTLNNQHWKTKKIQNMYCNASISYTPVIATVSNPKALSAQRKREKRCNLLILKTMGNKNKDLIAEKKVICAKAQ